MLPVPPLAVAVTLFIVGDDDVELYTPMVVSVPPVAVAITSVIDGDDDELYTP